MSASTHTPAGRSPLRRAAVSMLAMILRHEWIRRPVHRLGLLRWEWVEEAQAIEESYTLRFEGATS